ncbi:hypothetical protein VRRI112168_13315 [Vreelandella rituensis]
MHSIKIRRKLTLILCYLTPASHSADRCTSKLTLFLQGVLMSRVLMKYFVDFPSIQGFMFFQG